LAACTPNLPEVPGIPGFGPAVIDVMPGLRLGVPRGYCLDRAASTIAEEGSTCLLGPFHDEAGAAPAVLRVSFGAAGSASALAADPAALAAFFASEAGRATLSPTGRASDVRILKALTQGPDFLLLIQSTREGEYWRAISGLSGRLLTVSAIGTNKVPLPVDQSRAIVEKTLLAQRAVN
jgi:hypothetical protein